MPEQVAATDRTRVLREPQRAVYDRDAIYTILDEGFVCHVGFAVDGQTFVIPTMYARVGDALYFHGSAASRMLRGLSAGLNVCITVTLTDGRQSTQTCDSARGDFQRPYQEAEIRAKFRELAGLLLTPEGVTAIEHAVQHCEQWTSVRELTDQFRRYGQP